MHCKLREREIDTLFIEGFVNSLVDVEINSPIIRAVHPNTRNYIHTACVQCMKSYKRGGFIQDTLIGSKNPINDFLYLVIIFPIIDSYNPLYTTCLLYTSDAADE